MVFLSLIFRRRKQPPPVSDWRVHIEILMSCYVLSRFLETWEKDKICKKSQKIVWSTIWPRRGFQDSLWIASGLHFGLDLQHPEPHLEPILETIWESCSTAFRHCCDRRTAQEEDHATSLSFLPNHGFNISFVTFCTLQRIARFFVHKGQPNWKAIIVPRQPFNLNPCTVKQAQKKKQTLAWHKMFN